MSSYKNILLSCPYLRQGIIIKFVGGDVLVIKSILVALAIMLCSSAFCADIDTWKKLAEQGDAAAQALLGNAYYKGEGVTQDYKESVTWCLKAAEQGDASAQALLGDAYYTGKGVTQDHKEGVTWYRKAAEQGVTAAQANLGFAYHQGEGVPQDYKEAYFWWNLAASQDARFAIFRDGVATKLTPDKVEEVQDRCKKWSEDFEKRKR